MFPIPKDHTYEFKKKEIHLYRTFKTEEEKGKYIDLLNTEMKVINKMNLGKKALELYNLKYDKPFDKVSKRCLDFKMLETCAKSYNPVLRDIEQKK